MNILVLDDDLNRHQKFKQLLAGNKITPVTTAKDAIAALLMQKFDVAYLDHDLGGEAYVPSTDGTGWEVAEWLSKNAEHQPDKIIIHSLNHKGALKMMSVLPESEYQPFAWESEYQPFAWEDFKKGLDGFWK